MRTLRDFPTDATSTAPPPPMTANFVRVLSTQWTDPGDDGRALRVVVVSVAILLGSVVLSRADEPVTYAAPGFEPRTGLGEPRGIGRPKPMGHGEPQRQAPFLPGRSPYATGHRQRPKYFVPPTLPRTPTWPLYGLPPGVRPGDWPTYAPLGMGGYRFPAVGSQAYR